MTNTSMLQYISSCSLIVWPYQYTFLHKNCIVTAYLNPSDKIYKIVKYKSNIQKSHNSKPKTIYKKSPNTCIKLGPREGTKLIEPHF